MSENPCAHARSAAEFITSRAIMGREKYGHTLADAALSTAALVRHAREEAADLLVYLTGLEAGMTDERSVADRMHDPATQADAAMERAQRSGDETAAATWAVAAAVFALRDAVAKPVATREAVTRVVTAQYPDCSDNAGDCCAPDRCPCARTIDAIMTLIGDAP